MYADLQTLHEEARAIFAALTPEQWTGRSTTPAGTTITTWKWLRAMVEHEAHHRGQLYFTLGLLGVPTPPIYGLSEAELLAQSSEHGMRPPQRQPGPSASSC